eukprot:TRINITY_DN88644_c0_g1_i1.p1 TRINITY_DN88644_c0_g1~~TRINITY_DN88644_c0_g1_i1.p1  ORF type:complete len:288 (-),score=59.75 TRINITY_DN88644_c0_g1_i1:124-966(-)
MFSICACRRRATEPPSKGGSKSNANESLLHDAKSSDSGGTAMPSEPTVVPSLKPSEGRMCPVTGLLGACPMARPKNAAKDGDKPQELKVLMMLAWEEGGSKVSVGVYPHMSPYWEALGLPDTSSKEEVKAKYRKLSIQYHPDKCKEDGAKDRFQKIQEAYDGLKDLDGELAFPWDKYPEKQQEMPGTELIKTFGFLGAEAVAEDPIKGQFMQQVVKTSTECRVLMFDRETIDGEKITTETWGNALCVDSRTGSNHLVKVYRRIVSSGKDAAACEMEELED